MQLSQRFSRDNDVHSLLLMSQLVVSAQLHEKLDQANAEIEQLNSELQRDNRILNPINRNSTDPIPARSKDLSAPQCHRAHVLQVGLSTAPRSGIAMVMSDACLFCIYVP
jgi:TolA-binding protein